VPRYSRGLVWKLSVSPTCKRSAGPEADGVGRVDLVQGGVARARVVVGVGQPIGGARRGRERGRVEAGAAPFSPATNWGGGAAEAPATPSESSEVERNRPARDGATWSPGDPAFVGVAPGA
jgi:hypothetical protein